jgi:PAS domain S-box-containing protein
MSASSRPTDSQTRGWVEAVLELMPVAVLLIDPRDGDVLWANSAADRLADGHFPRGQERFGDDDEARYVPRDPRTGEKLRREETASHIAMTTGRRVEGFQFDWDTPRGQRALVASADLLPPIGDMGRAVVVSFEDVTELRTAQRTSGDAIALLDTMFSSAPVGLAYFDRDLRYVRVNDALAEFNGVPVDDHVGRTVMDVVPAVDPSVLDLFRRVIETGEPITDVEVVGHSPAHEGVERTWLEGFYPVRGADDEIIGLGAVVVDITERKASEAAIEQALAAEREARAAAEAAATRARFLAEASALLDRSLDYAETLRSVAALAVPDIADWCSVDALEQGELRNVAVTHIDPNKVALGERLLSEYPPAPHSPDGLMQVVSTGRSQLLEDVRDETLVANARSPEHLALLREMGMRSTMIVPMISRGRMIGTITLVSAESGRRFGDQDVLLAEDLARRAAVAVDNARLYSERAQIARTLQDSLLPERLPTIPGVEVAARYVAAGEGIEVGGDFYDLFELGEGDWSVVMGDVCGKGADAAALTALARYTLRATASPATRPSETLQTLNDAVLRQRGDGRFVTVAYARMTTNGRSARLTLSSGGHPPPIVLRADGHAEPVGPSGTLLGVVPDPQLSEETIELGPGDALFLYTDGVTEAHAPDHLLEAADVARMLEKCGGSDAVELVRCVEESVRALSVAPPGDDIAMLALRIPA